MLVINGVILAVRNQPEQVRKLQRHKPRVLYQGTQSGSEPADVRHVGEDVVGRD